MARIAQLQRPEFLGRRFDYNAGEHVGFFEPTQQGKTYLLWQMLLAAIAQNPGLSVVVCMPKARDPATRAWAERTGMRIIESWPPPGRWPGQDRPPGYVLWPRHPVRLQAAQRREYLGGIFRTALTRQLDAGNSITVADDFYRLAGLMGLNPECEEILTTGGSAGAGLWLANQKPSGTRQGAITTFAYNQPTHVILGNEPIAENRRRFAEIGGVDSGLVARVVAALPKHPVNTAEGIKYISEKLYIRKDGPFMAVVGI